jgi:hypothetical protein
LFEARESRIRVDNSFALEPNAEAHVLPASGKTEGKIVLALTD